MLFLMTVFLIVFVSATVVFSMRIVLILQERAQDKIFKIKDQYEKQLREKKRIASKRRALSEEAIGIFTLYEMTKEITKKLSAEEAFEVFKNKLRPYQKTGQSTLR